MSRSRRSLFQIVDALKKLEVGWDGAVTVLAGAPPFKDRYNKAADDLVEDLTGIGNIPGPSRMADFDNC